MDPTTTGADALVALAKAIHDTTGQYAVDYTDSIWARYTICSSPCSVSKTLDQDSWHLLSRAGVLRATRPDDCSAPEAYWVTAYKTRTGPEEDKDEDKDKDGKDATTLCFQGIFNLDAGWIVINHLTQTTEPPALDGQTNMANAALPGFIWTRIAGRESKGKQGVVILQPPPTPSSSSSTLRAVVFGKLNDYASPRQLAMLKALGASCCVVVGGGSLLNTLDPRSGKNFLIGRDSMMAPVRFEDLFEEGGVCRFLSDVLTSSQAVFRNRYPTELLLLGQPGHATRPCSSLLVLLDSLLDGEQAGDMAANPSLPPPPPSPPSIHPPSLPLPPTVQSVCVRSPVLNLNLNHLRHVRKSHEALIEDLEEAEDDIGPRMI